MTPSSHLTNDTRTDPSGSVLNTLGSYLGSLWDSSIGRFASQDPDSTQTSTLGDPSEMEPGDIPIELVLDCEQQPLTVGTEVDVFVEYTDAPEKESSQADLVVSVTIDGVGYQCYLRTEKQHRTYPYRAALIEQALRDEVNEKIDHNMIRWAAAYLLVGMGRSLRSAPGQPDSKKENYSYHTGSVWQIGPNGRGWWKEKKGDRTALMLAWDKDLACLGSTEDKSDEDI